MKLKDGTYTLDQLKARIAERKGGFKYVVLDDLIGHLNEEFLIEKPLPKGAKSDAESGGSPDPKAVITKSRTVSHFFRSVSRDAGLGHRNYQTLPESIGLIDYNP